jgi:hypothetical protein
LFAVSDCKISKLTADPAGGTATYATAVDVPGIKTMSIGGDVNTVELRGDNQSLDQNSVLGSLTVSVEHAKISLDVLDVLLGTTTTDSGTTPNMIATTVLLGTNTMNYFKIEGKTPTAGADTVTGDLHFVLHKCILSSFPDLGLAEEDYQTVSFEAVAIPLLANAKSLSIVANETAVVIS